MTDKKSEPIRLQRARTRLEQPTIMNAALAAKYGVAYVRLCVFAIDIDRAYAELEDEESPSYDAALPFGWEVFLTEAYLLRALPATGDGEPGLIEETCLSILEQAPDEQGYGSQLLFAVYDAIVRGQYPESLRTIFRSWHKPPKQLLASLAALSAAPSAPLATLAELVLSAELDPPLAPPTRTALEAMRYPSW
jgi:hypothetical protein